jgi:hypothetical protein
MHSMGEYEEAEKMFQRSLEIKRLVLGPNHPDVASALSNLGLRVHRYKIL